MKKKAIIKEIKSWENCLTLNDWNLDTVVNEMRELIDEIEPKISHHWYCTYCGHKARFSRFDGDSECKCDIERKRGVKE